MKKAAIQQRAFRFNKSVLIAFTLFLVFFYLSVFAQRASWVAPKEADIVKNPLTTNAASAVQGRALYIANCGPCHGEKGRGDGPASQGLNPKPADHTSVAVQSQSDGAIFWKLGEGRAPMPGYKKIFSDQQRWGLINYIRTLAKTGKK